MAHSTSGSSGTVAAVAVAGVAIPTAIGYLAGGSADRKTFLVTIEPETK